MWWVIDLTVLDPQSSFYKNVRKHSAWHCAFVTFGGDMPVLTVAENACYDLLSRSLSVKRQKSYRPTGLNSNEIEVRRHNTSLHLWLLLHVASCIWREYFWRPVFTRPNTAGSVNNLTDEWKNKNAINSRSYFYPVLFYL